MDVYMKRFDRRKRLLAQKRNGAFDPNQYYLERDKNSRALRKIRVLLRKMEPVSLMGTAWDPRTSDILSMSSVLATGTPEVWMHLANCREIWNWDSENSEKWMVARVADALGLTSVSRSLSQLGGAGFQDCLWELIDHGQGRHRSAICLHGFHQVHPATATAFGQWMSEYMRQTGAHDRMLTVLATGPTGSLKLEATEVIYPAWEGLECLDEEDALGPARLRLVTQTGG